MTPTDMVRIVIAGQFNSIVSNCALWLMRKFTNIVTNVVQLPWYVSELLYVNTILCSHFCMDYDCVLMNVKHMHGCWYNDE